ncbi:dehydrogenase (plasmid) [Rhodococcus sp. WB1]|uniref:Gfo/Idh/MocA family protein n=1 Tax=Rhodococcus sp. WB1 TaxID=1033922 RepID=UPI00081A7128|nr:Gfo/Idh/MocA family oxidoreductase [Rhodococcus sp. WB1]ANZ28554.1 dehydrogenase [Rhodococcus sp. WB1]
MSSSSFFTQGDARADVDEVPSIGIGMLGYAFMGRAHTNAFHKIGYTFWPPALRPRLVHIAGRNADAVAEAARRYGYDKSTTDWREVVNDPDVQVFDNGGPNDQHLEPTVAAARAGKHVICEKPLGRTADEAFELWSAVAETGVKAMTAFNYRFFPAIRLVKEMLDDGTLGEVRHFRARYHQEWLVDPETPASWRLTKEAAGSGALGDLGAHIIDLARYLVGEPESVSANTATFVEDRPGGHVDVDDAFDAVVRFESGALGTLEATRVAPGRKNHMRFEISTTKGAVIFDQERMNELQVHLIGTTPGDHAQGFRTVLVSEIYHPYWENWWPHGHMIGWEDSFVHELEHLLSAIRHDKPIGPHGATLEDGYRCAEICDAILRAADTGERQKISYRGLSA